MSSLSVLPVVATLLAEASVFVPPVDPVVVPIGAGHSVAAPPAPAPQASTGMDSGVTRWYGAPSVAADVTEVALFFGVLGYDGLYNRSHHVGAWHAPGAKAAAELLGISTLVSGAVVHGLHHHGGRAAGSIALRAGAMLVGGLVVIAADIGCVNGSEETCQSNGQIGVSALIGLMLGAMAMDDAILARDYGVPAATPAQGAWTPTLRIQSGLALLGVGGAF